MKNLPSKDALLVAPRQELIDIISHLTNEIAELKFKMDWFQRQIFGAKSERFVPGDDLQTMLDLGIVTPDVPEPTTQDITYSRTKVAKSEVVKGHGRSQMPTHLPIVEEVIQPSEDTKDLVQIGEEISWHYEMKPGSLFVKKIVRPKFARPNSEGIVIGTLPPLAVDKGNAGPGLMAYVTIDKYVYHLPLDRQRKKFHNEYAVQFSESWLSDIVKNTAFWLEAPYRAYVERLIKSTYVQADETPIPVLTTDSKGKTHRGYYWVYYDPLEKIVIFDYRKSRSADGPSDFLKDFKGILQVDGYDGYDPISRRNDIARAACMDHVRRRFEKALEFDRERANYALSAMAPWYERETQAKENGLNLEQRFEIRSLHTVPEMNAFGEWLLKESKSALPQSPIGKAIAYALNQWSRFQPFMTDKRVELSNILIENAIRPVALGRKNYMFKGSHEAAQRGAIIYSIASIAKLHGYDPFTYVEDLLRRLPSSINRDIPSFLLPQWKPAK